MAFRIVAESRLWRKIGAVLTWAGTGELKDVKRSGWSARLKCGPHKCRQLFAGFVVGNRAQRWQGCRLRGRQRNGDRLVEDVVKGAGQTWRLRKLVCERAVHVVLLGKLIEGRKDGGQHARLS